MVYLRLFVSPYKHATYEGALWVEFCRFEVAVGLVLFLSQLGMGASASLAFYFSSYP
jgi:hypothetical protein